MLRPIFFITVAFGLAVIGPSYSGALAQPRLDPRSDQTQKQPVEVSIDPKIQPTQTELPGLNHGPSRAVGAMVGPDGRTLEFVTNEIVLHPASEKEVQDFIIRYHAIVLRDGMPLVHPDVKPRDKPTSSGWYLLRIDPSTSTLEGLADSLASAGGRGVYRFSSEEAARTLAVVARERGSSIAINPIVTLDASFEHPLNDNASTFIDAEQFFWFVEDNDPFTAGDQGLSTGVTHAWDYLSYHGILEVPGSYYIPKIAIIDVGFDLDPASGVPLHGNLDYGTLGAPIQYDVVDHDFTAGGEGVAPDRWHGQGSFGVAAARPKNMFGSAGVGGHFVRPMLIRISPDFYSVAYAIRSAVLGGADVISVSLSTGCLLPQPICALGHYPAEPLSEMMLQSVRFARSYLAIVVASAGNDGEDLGGLGVDAHPCETEGVICVGGVDTSKMNAGNFGERVDIWAPVSVLTTTTPDSIIMDTDNFGVDELQPFIGTSASAPFVAGAVGLMKMANPNLSYEQVLSIIQSTANSSPDPRVPKGTIDVYRAVRGLILNQPPFVQITNPPQGTTLGWKFSPLMQANYFDPEVRPVDVYRWKGEVVYASDRDGELCRSSVPPYTCSSSLAQMTVGTHTITATATDAFGESGSHQISINVVNRPPEPKIVQPQATSTIYSHIPVAFSAFVPDPDETIADASISWTSSRDGPLGAGRNLTHLLTAGEHAITLTAVDGKGLSEQAQVTVNVTAGGGLPVPQIVSPGWETFVWSGTPITLQGIATDPEDGTLPGGQLTWQSDIDGPLGAGNTISRTLSGPPSPCHPESVGHQVTLTATDSDQHSVSVHTLVRVGVIC
jgi:serine protease